MAYIRYPEKIQPISTTFFSFQRADSMFTRLTGRIFQDELLINTVDSTERSLFIEVQVVGGCPYIEAFDPYCVSTIEENMTCAGYYVHLVLVLH